MPKLMVVYDPQDKVSGLPIEMRRQYDIMEATLSIPEDLEGLDIYALARKLSELLLEQL
jgi:hypothetical protein